MTKKTNIKGMKYCGDCLCFDFNKIICRVNGDKANANHTACITPGGKIEVDYNIYPTKEKCANCKNPCGKKVV